MQRVINTAHCIHIHPYYVYERTHNFGGGGGGGRPADMQHARNGMWHNKRREAGINKQT